MQNKNIGMQKVRSSNFVMAALFIFLIAFPKAGFKVSEVPITFGYLILALAAIWSVVAGFSNGRAFRFEKWQLYELLALLPLQIFSLLCVIAIGFTDTAYTIAYFVSFLALPTMFLFAMKDSISRLDPDVFLLYLRRSVSFAAIYGIFLFIWRIRFGEFIEIPFLTVNADDVGTLDEAKHISRGVVTKLISTYNNGNIFGVCMLMLLPLYDASQRSFLLKLAVRISLLLTLSRTVWLGLVAYEIFAAFYIRQAGLKALLFLVISLVAVVAGVIVTLSYIGLDIGFLFDRNLGGRADILLATRLIFLPDTPIEFVSEVIYANVVNAFGLAGLGAFLFSVVTPVIAAWRHSPKGEYDRSITLGMLMFLVCGFSDGPMLYIPVMAIYWCLACLGISRISWPNRETKAISLSPHSSS